MLHNIAKASLCAGILLAALMLPSGSHPRTAAAQDVMPEIPADATEEELIARLRRVSAPLDKEATPAMRPLMRQVQLKWVLAHADALLARFPQTGHRDEAQLARLGALAELARTDADALRDLLLLTAEIADSKPTGRLAAENAFYATQAFVLAARAESMPDERRLLGSIERYRAYLEDHPEGERRSTVHASLIWNLLDLKNLDEARQALERMHREFPDDPATLHARAEVARAAAVGKPFEFVYRVDAQKTVRSSEFTGKVVVVRLAREAAKDAGLEALRALHGEYRDMNLAVFEVVWPAAGSAGKAVTPTDPWPIYPFEETLNKDALPFAGLVRPPVYYVIDRNGVLRGIDRGSNVEALVREAMNPAPDPTASDPPPAPSDKPQHPRPEP